MNFIFILLTTLLSHQLYSNVSYFFNHTNPRALNALARISANNVSTLFQPDYDITAENNGDAKLSNNYVGAHTKALEHDAITGILTANGAQQYTKLLTAIASLNQNDYNAIARAAGATMKFVNPQASGALTLEGIPNSLIAIPHFPTLSSAAAAAILIEVYLQAICRDVLFADYGTGAGSDVDTFNGGSLTNNAAAILTALGSAFDGPKIAGAVTAATLFRGGSPADLVGPYMSQFAYFFVPVESQLSVGFKPYVDVAQSREFGVSWNDYIALQNGTVPRPYNGLDFSGQRYIIDGRDVATLVHNDGPGEIFFYIANILMKNNFPRSSALPYFNGSMTNEVAFVTMAVTDIYAAMFGACLEGMKHAWAHKWLGNRALRPEAFAGLVHYAKITSTNPYNLHASFFATYGGIGLLAWIKNNNEKQASVPNDPLPLPDAQTYLLSQIFPESCPDHPTNPSGHATFSGACVTILKAFFKNDALIKDFIQPVKPNPADPTTLVNLPDGEGANILTVGGELDKVASNIAIGRDFAGIHYRQDAEQGILLGQMVALRYLCDHARNYAEAGFTGFELTLRYGEQVRVTAEGITFI